MADVSEEASLLVRARSGDTVAFDSLITLHRERIYVHVFQIVPNEEDALNLTQKTFLRAWKSLTRYDAAAPFSSWLYRIATNAAIDLCRRRHRRPQTEIASGALNIDPASRTTPSQPEAPGRSVDRASRGERLYGAQPRTPRRHRAQRNRRSLLRRNRTAPWLHHGHGYVAALLCSQETSNLTS